LLAASSEKKKTPGSCWVRPFSLVFTVTYVRTLSSGKVDGLTGMSFCGIGGRNLGRVDCIRKGTTPSQALPS